MASPAFFCFQIATYDMLRKFSQFAVLREAEDTGQDPTYGLKRGDIIQAWAGAKAIVVWIGNTVQQDSANRPSVDVGLIQQDEKDYEKAVHCLAQKDYETLYKLRSYSYPAANIAAKRSKVSGNVDGAAPEQVKQLTGVEMSPASAPQAGPSAGGDRQMYHLDQKNGSFIFTPAG